MPQIKIDEQRMDFVFYLADDTLLHMEFQTIFSLKDLERFKLYDALLYEQKKKPVNTAIIYGAGISDKFIDKVYVQKMMEVLKMTQVLQALYKEFKEEGKAEGKAEGEINLLCKFLKTKFGLKAFELQKKIRKFNNMELIDEITEKLFTAESLKQAELTIEEALELQEKIRSNK
ncbi:MAG: hypothetical protein ABRQ38_04940 [Candidatus Eremiobacterota bacterium]